MKQERPGKITYKYVCKDWNKVTQIKYNVSCVQSVIRFLATLKVLSCKLYNNKYMIASTQITNTEIFAFIAVLVFKLC